MTTVRRFLGDLLVLAGLALHPLRWWKAWRSLAAELFRQGGVTIDTPAADEGEPIALRTVIQPDGDVLVLVREGPVPDDELLIEHRDRVDRWYQGNRHAVHQAAGALRAVVSSLSLASAAASGWAGSQRASGLTAVLLGFVVPCVVFPVAKRGLGTLASLFLRRRMDRWLGGASTLG